MSFGLSQKDLVSIEKLNDPKVLSFLDQMNPYLRGHVKVQLGISKPLRNILKVK